MSAGRPELPDELPEILLAAFDGEARLLEWTLALSPSARREIAQWVLEPKGEEARARRAEQMAERLMAAMEGERELPPILARALGRAAGAREGWESMTVAQRRWQLLALFGARSLETRQRQVERIVEACLERREK